MADKPPRLRLSPDLLARVHTYFVDAAKKAKEGAVYRDDDLAYYDDLLQLRGALDMRGPWRGSCQLEDPLVREQHTQLHSKLAPPLQRDLLVMVDATDPADQDSAKNVEMWLAFKNAEENFADEFSNFIANGLRDPTAVIACTWQQEYSHERGVSYWDGESKDEETDEPLLIPAEARQEGTDYQQIPTVEERVESQNAVYETIDLADFYPYPANQQRLDTAPAVFVRRLFTEAELLNGVLEHGCDKAQVMALIQAGPTLVEGHMGVYNRVQGTQETQTNNYVERMNIDTDNRNALLLDNRNRLDSKDGTQPLTAERSDGLYECFEGWGFLPKLWEDDEPLLPEKYFHDRVRVLLCPQHALVFMLDFAPYQGLPFFHGSMLRQNGRFLGMGLVQLMETGGLAATYLTRWTLDSLQFEMTPALVMNEDDYHENGSFSLYPGAKFTESVPNSMRPLMTTQKSSMGFEGIEHILNRFKSLAAAEGIGEMSGKVRRNPEMLNVMQTADAKYGLYGYNLYSVLPQLAAWRVALELQFNPDFEQTIQTSQGQIKVSADDLRKKYRFSAIQISADSNPETRAGRTQQILSIQATYIQGVQAFPQWAVELWHGARKAMLDLNERDPAQYLGDEQRAQMIVQSVMQAAQMQAQGAAAGAMPSQGGGSPLSPLAPNTLLPHIGPQAAVGTP